MYGYVRPDKGELKVSEYERFRGVYCGLCHELKARYGPICRFLVNYDFTFLAMLLAGETPSGEKLCRCPYHPLRKTACPCHSENLAAAADCTVVLAWWKLKDGIADSGFLKALVCRLACGALRRSYRRAAERVPAFAETVERNLAELNALESENCDSIDAVADKFALILQSAADAAADAKTARILRQLLYHLGRIVYILDAVDDLAEDVRAGGYNPLKFRFALLGDKLLPEDEATLRESLQMSHDCLCNAFVLLTNNPYSSILENTIYFGLPKVTQSVFAGTWKSSVNKKRERSPL